MENNEEIKKEEKKHTLLVTIISIALLTAVVMGASYAFFAASVGTGATTNVTVVSKTTDSLAFNPGTALSINATQQNFYSGAGNLTSTTNATANLTANNTEAAQYCYTVSLVVSANNFVYSVDSTKPEITFSISKNGTDIIKDQDITTLNSTLNVPTTLGGSILKHQLSAAASQSVTDTFVPTITFVNLGTNQKANENKSLTAVIQFTKVDC